MGNALFGLYVSGTFARILYWLLVERGVTRGDFANSLSGYHVLLLLTDTYAAVFVCRHSCHFTC